MDVDYYWTEWIDVPQVGAVGPSRRFYVELHPLGNVRRIRLHPILENVPERELAHDFDVSHFDPTQIEVSLRTPDGILETVCVSEDGYLNFGSFDPLMGMKISELGSIRLEGRYPDNLPREILDISYHIEYIHSTPLPLLPYESFAPIHGRTNQEIRVPVKQLYWLNSIQLEVFYGKAEFRIRINGVDLQSIMPVSGTTLWSGRARGNLLRRPLLEGIEEATVEVVVRNNWHSDEEPLDLPVVII